MHVHYLEAAFGFLSTPSARRATPACWSSRCGRSISIHALREEGDDPLQPDGDKLPAISIHALREEGDFQIDFFVVPLQSFLSTPSARRATLDVGIVERYLSIFLSTPSARRATTLFPLTGAIAHYFYPRPPRGGRRNNLKRALAH